ncbi:hypothetical protein [Arcobacter sp. YIC-80]|uniref:hypothetical protein n=1 Tax=unclassified Arcobacter TaxID=2593671 RepID=UPI003850517A
MLKTILFTFLVLNITLNANTISVEEIDCENLFEKCIAKCENKNTEEKDLLCVEKCELEFDKCLISQEVKLQNENLEEYQENEQYKN